MKNIIRAIGLISVLFFLFVVLSDWQFNNYWLPITLINVGSISILLEIWFRIKNDDKKFVFGVVFIFMLALVFYGSTYLGTVLNYNFLNFRTTVYSKDKIHIDRYDGLFGKHIGDHRTYYLLRVGCWKSLIKEDEVTQINEKTKECEVIFIKNNIRFNKCTKVKYP